MDACIIVVSLVETGIDVWAQASWNPNMISGKKRKLLRLTWIETRCVESTEAVASDADGSVTNSSQLRVWCEVSDWHAPCAVCAWCGSSDMSVP